MNPYDGSPTDPTRSLRFPSLAPLTPPSWAVERERARQTSGSGREAVLARAFAQALARALPRSRGVRPDGTARLIHYGRLLRRIPNASR